MKTVRVGVIGAGFWARYQILAWKQIEGVKVTAITNRTLKKAERLAADLDIPAVASTPAELVSREDVDLVDIITSESSHRDYTLLAARAGKHAITQKPMAETFDECREMVAACEESGVRLFVHDNWRYQTPVRSFLEWYRQRPVGAVRRARFSYLSSFPVFEMQPALREAERFMLMDMGTHIVDTARAFVGDLAWVVAQTATVTPEIAGEDVATILAGASNGAHAVIELSYASPTEGEHELETLVQLECDDGVMMLDHGFRAVVTRHDGTSVARRFPPTVHDWLIPRYTLSMGSCLPANESFVRALRTGQPSESDGRSYLNTMDAVFAAYLSAAENRIVHLTAGGTP